MRRSWRRRGSRHNQHETRRRRPKRLPPTWRVCPMPEFLVSALPGLVLMLLAAALGVVAYRHNNTKQLREIQTQVIATYQAQSAAQSAQNEMQGRDITALQEEVVRLKRIVRAIQRLEIKRGATIEINGEYVTLIEKTRADRMRTIQIRIEAEDETKNDTSKEA